MKRILLLFFSFIFFIFTAQSEAERTELHNAVTGASIEKINELLTSGADPNAKESKLGQTPLHLAVVHKIEAIRPLLRGGANINAGLIFCWYLTEIFS